MRPPAAPEPRPENPPSPAAPAPDLPLQGTDDGLILWMLSLTPSQRLEVAQGFVDSIHALRHGNAT